MSSFFLLRAVSARANCRPLPRVANEATASYTFSTLLQAKGDEGTSHVVALQPRIVTASVMRRAV